MRAEAPPWRTLLSYVRPHAWAVVGGGLLGLLGGTAGLAQPLAAKSVIDEVSRDGSATGATLLLGGLVLLGAVITALGRYVLERTGESVVLTARARLIRRMLGLRVSAIDQVAPGDLMSRLTSDITLLRSVTTHSMVNGVIGVLTVLGATALMVTTDLVLMGATLGVFAVTSCAMSLIMPRISRASQRTQAAIGQMGSVLERALGAFRTMKASGAEQREIANATGASRVAWGHGIRAARWQAAATVVGTVSSQLTFLVVLAVGAARVASGSLSLSSLIMFLLYVLYVSAPLSQVFAAVTQWQLGLAAVRRLQEVERLPQEPVAGAPAGTGPAPASVTFSGVSFGYRAQPVLRDVTIVVPPRGMTAIVGPSGAGKSTLFALLERFYEAESGVVTVDGRDVRQWPLAELRAAIGYVEQDAPVLAGTLRDNLCYAAPAATDDEINAVLDMARLTGLLDQLPDGLDTPIGHRGSTLSGGQRQRVAVARALLRRPRLLLLDEVTSQLDAASELALREAIEDIALTTTVVVIAHRLSTVTNADRIVVLDAGMVRAIGTHQELVASDDLYRELVAGQLLRTGTEAAS